MTSIEDLGRRVEEARHGSRELDVLIECVTNGGGYDYATDHRPSTVPGKVVSRHKNGGRTGTYNAPLYTYNVDDALRLIERMLPGTHRHVSIDLFSTGRSGCILNVNTDDEMHADGATAPLAIIAALLKALSALRSTKDEGAEGC